MVLHRSAGHGQKVARKMKTANLMSTVAKPGAAHRPTGHQDKRVVGGIARANDLVSTADPDGMCLQALEEGSLFRADSETADHAIHKGSHRLPSVTSFNLQKPHSVP
jgi:hypothetical protein